MNDHLAKYEGIHKGERCWIIGNGPSLNDTDLDLIADEVSFGMNRIPLIYSRTKWRPKYYVYCSTNVEDPRWGDAWTESVQIACQAPQVVPFIWSKFRDRIFPSGDFGSVEWFDTVTELGKGIKPGGLETPWGQFSLDPVKYLDKSGTTMSVALQMAAYMGFAQIFIVGADMNWKNSDGTGDDPNHFDPTYTANIDNGLRDRICSRKTHAYAYKMMSRKGIQVFNATVSTFLDVYPLVNYKNVAKNKDFAWNNCDDMSSHEIPLKRQRLQAYWTSVGEPQP